MSSVTASGPWVLRNVPLALCGWRRRAVPVLIHLLNRRRFKEVSLGRDAVPAGGGAEEPAADPDRAVAPAWRSARWW